MNILEHVIHTDLIKETPYSKTFVGRLDDSSKVIIKLLKHANLELFEILSGISAVHFPKILELSRQIENGETELTVIEEYIEGDTLSELQSKRRFSYDEICSLALQLCEGISFLHQMNPPFIHRDIKPENLILSTDGILKIIDFNAARIYRTDADNDTIRLGTAKYAPPEQFGYSQTDVRSDIYSIGVTLYKLYYGTDFEQNAINAHSAQTALDSVISKCTMYDPNQRYQTATELQADLLLCQKPDSPETRKPGKKNYLIAGFLLLTAIFIVGVFAHRKNPSEPASVLQSQTTGAQSVTDTSTTVSETQSAAETTSDAETQPVAETTSATETQTAAETTSDIETQTAAETTSATETQPVAETTSATETQTAAKTTSATETQPIAETTSDAVSQPVAVTESGSQFVIVTNDSISLTIPLVEGTHIVTFELFDSAGQPSEVIELRHNASSPKFLPQNTLLKIDGNLYASTNSNFKVSQNVDNTFTLVLYPQHTLGQPASAYAGYTYTVSSTALPKLSAPEQIQWSATAPGKASWHSDYPCVMFIYEGGNVRGYNAGLHSNAGLYSCSIADIMQQQSNTYAVGAMALGDWTYGDSDVVMTETIDYQIPEEKMPVVTGLSFTGTTLHITPVENASGYNIRLMGLTYDTHEWIELNKSRGIENTSSDLHSWISQYQGKYEQLGVRVKSLSSDFSKAASDYSEICVYTP